MPTFTEWRAVLHGDGIRLLRPLAFDRFPLEETVYGEDAPAQAVCIAECRQSVHRLAFGVDRLAAACWVLAPVGNEPPPQRVKRDYSSLVITPDDQ